MATMPPTAKERMLTKDAAQVIRERLDNARNGSRLAHEEVSDALVQNAAGANLDVAKLRHRAALLQGRMLELEVLLEIFEGR